MKSHFLIPPHNKMCPRPWQSTRDYIVAGILSQKKLDRFAFFFIFGGTLFNGTSGIIKKKASLQHQFIWYIESFIFTFFSFFFFLPSIELITLRVCPDKYYLFPIKFHPIRDDTELSFFFLNSMHKISIQTLMIWRNFLKFKWPRSSWR